VRDGFGFYMMNVGREKKVKKLLWLVHAHGG